jgi:hypothetical protein
MSADINKSIYQTAKSDIDTKYAKSIYCIVYSWKKSIFNYSKITDKTATQSTANKFWRALDKLLDKQNTYLF